MATPPSPPILGMYQTNGAFPTPGPSAWPSGSGTNLSATYWAWEDDWNTDIQPFITKCNNNGLIPFVELEPWNFDQSAIPFASITAGQYDSLLQSIGSNIAATGKPCILTFAHEMNVSGQYPWSQGDKGSGPGGGTLTPAQWQAGWKYVHDKVNSTANGLVLWMWACSAWTGGTTVNPTPWWPGASYVDMVGIDGYPSTEFGQSLGTFAGQIQQTVTAIRNLGWTDPIFIAETNLGQMANGGSDGGTKFGPGESISNFVADMHKAGISGILEFEDASWGLPQMTAAQWTEYNNAISTAYGTPPTSGSGNGSSGAGTGTLTVVEGTPDEVHATNGKAQSVTPISPPAGSMVRWEAAWLNSNDTLGFTFTAKDSNGTDYGPPTLKGNPGDGDGGCYLLIWDVVYQAAPGPITLTITASGTGLSGAAPSDCLILPYIITGQASTPQGAFNDFSEVGTSTTTYEISLTTTTPGSVVFVLGAPNHNGGATGAVTPISSTVTDVDWDDANVGSRGTFGRSKNPTTTPGATTFGWTSAHPSPNGYGVMVSEIVPATPSSGGGGTSGGTSSGTNFAAVGQYIQTTDTSFSWTPTKAGNSLVVIALSETAGAPVTGVSSSNATWTQVVPDQTLGSTTVTEATAFIGVATKPRAQTVNLATTAGTGNLRVLAREFDSNGVPIALDTFVTMDGDASDDVTAWPSIVPTKGGSELLFGFERNFNDNAGAAAAGTSANTEYYIDANGNGAAVNLSVSAATAIGWDDSDARSVLALLLYTSPTGTGDNGNGSTGTGGTGATGASLWYDGAVGAGLNAKAALLNGGTLQVYSGSQPPLNGGLTGTLLATLAFSATAFAPATAANGVATVQANAITSGVAADSGTAGYFALVTSSGQTVVTGTVAVSGADLNLPSTAITSGTLVGVTSFALTESEIGV